MPDPDATDRDAPASPLPPPQWTPEMVDALREIVEEWVGEGFTTPPYTAARYDVFEALGIDRAASKAPGDGNWWQYDTRRRPAGQERTE